MSKATLNWALTLVLALLCSAAFGEDVDLCALGQNPARFNGKMITVRATTWHTLENHGMKTDQCEVSLDWRTPEHAGFHVPFGLLRDESWQTFIKYDSLTSPIHTIPETELHYLVTATFHGVLVYRPHQKGGPFLVIESVSNVKVQPH